MRFSILRIFDRLQTKLLWLPSMELRSFTFLVPPPCRSFCCYCHSFSFSPKKARSLLRGACELMGVPAPEPDRWMLSRILRISSILSFSLFSKVGFKVSIGCWIWDRLSELAFPSTIDEEPSIIMDSVFVMEAGFWLTLFFKLL